MRRNLLSYPTFAVLACLTACGGTRSPTVDPTAPRPLLESSEQVEAAEAVGRRIVPRDLLEVTVFDAPELSGEPRVTDRGEISLPLLGVVRAAGQTPRELEAVLVERLEGTYMHDPHVAVQVKEEAPQPIYVLGEVNQPGAYATGGEGAVTLLRAVSLARGLTSGAAGGRTLVIRTRSDGARLQVPVDLDEVLTGQAPDVILEASDVVYVPRNTARAVSLGVIDALVRVLTFRPAF